MRRGEQNSPKPTNSSRRKSQNLSNEDLARLQKAQELIQPLKEKYGLAADDLLQLLHKELAFPVSVSSDKLTVLESVVKYLKEDKQLSLRQIANVVDRDERNVWHIYQKATKKFPRRFVVKDTRYSVPVSIFSNTPLSAQEAIVKYLKDTAGLSYHEIAVLMKRNDRTIWTVYQRGKKKNAK